MGENERAIFRGTGDAARNPGGGATIATKGLFLLLLATLGGLGWLGVSEARFQDRVARLDADLAAFRRLRWERPLLRGQPEDGNAVEAFFSALAAVKPPSEALRKGLADQLYYGQPLLPHQRAQLAAQEAALATLQEAAQRTWSMTPLRPELGNAMPVPDYERAFDGGLLLLARAFAQGGDECLLGAADVVRIGQDLVPGAPLEAMGIAMRIASVASSVVRGCTPSASPLGLQRAERAFRTLATHPPPSGHGLELADLVAATELRAAATLPPDADHLVIAKTLEARGGVMRSWNFYAEPHRFRRYSALAYPETLERWRKEDVWRRQSGLPNVAKSTDDRMGWLLDDMRAQAIIRGLAIGLSALSERQRRGGRIPPEPPNLRQPGLADPFNGRTMRHSFDAASGELTVWSVGEDVRDGEAQETWNEKAPLDVIVRLRAPRDERAATRRKRRRKP